MLPHAGVFREGLLHNEVGVHHAKCEAIIDAVQSFISNLFGYIYATYLFCNTHHE